MAKKNETEILSAYITEAENEVTEREEVKVEAVTPKRILESPLTRGDFDRVADDFDARKRSNLGYLKIPVDSLPTKGLFYPSDIEISIRSARGEEIKHWSTMNDTDIQQQSQVDDIFNYMIERCCVVKIPGVAGNCWKDLKNADRLYLLLAIREFTFTNENPLKVPYGEGKEDIPVVKEMIDFVKIPDELMRFYNPDNKSFTFNVDGQVINMYIPSIGVNDWIKKYTINKLNSREMFDKDFILYAAMLINDYRQLNNRKYEELVASTRFWGHKEWSVVSYVLDQLNNVTDPKIKYTDENGTEVEIPLNFRGGIKSIFLLSNPLLSIC